MVARCFNAVEPGQNTGPLLDNQATVARVLEEVSGKSIVHLAAHAVLGSMKDPMGSAVVLADGVPTGAGVARGLLRLDTLLNSWVGKLADCELVVLSCGQTGRGVKLGDSLMGLPIGFLNAGARSVVASLWNVNDLATCLLMTRFYQNVLGHHLDICEQVACMGREVWGERYSPGQGMAAAQALAEAKCWLRTISAIEVRSFLRAHPKPRGATVTIGRSLAASDSESPSIEQRIKHIAERTPGAQPFAHPKFWAAFVIIGDPNGCPHAPRRLAAQTSPPTSKPARTNSTDAGSSK